MVHSNSITNGIFCANSRTSSLRYLLFFQIDNSHYLKTKNITCYHCNNSIIEGLNDRGDIISSIHYPSKSLEVNLTYLRIEWMRAVFLSCRLIFCSFLGFFTIAHLSLANCNPRESAIARKNASSRRFFTRNPIIILYEFML